MSAEMLSRQADSLDVEFVNSTSGSTLRFFHRTGLLSSQRKELKTLPPTSGDTISSFVFRFEKGTNEFIEVEYKVKVAENGSRSVRRRAVVQETYKLANVRIDSDMLRNHSKIRVVDFEAGRSGAAVSSKKKFGLKTLPRARTHDAGWLVTVVMALYIYSGLKYVLTGFKYLFSGLLKNFRRLIPVTPPGAPVTPPEAEPTAHVSELTAQVPEPTAQVPEPTAQVPEPTAQVPEPTAQVPEPTAQVLEPPAHGPDAVTPDTVHPAQGTDAGWIRRVTEGGSSAINYVGSWIGGYIPGANSEAVLPR